MDRTTLVLTSVVFVLLFAVYSAKGETLLSNLDQVRDGAKPSPFAKLQRVDDPKAANALRSIAAIPSAIKGTGGLTADAASVLYIDEEGNRRYRTLTLSYNSDDDVTMTVQVDITGYGDWKTYRSLNVPKGESVTHRFPDDFNAYWVRTVSNTDTTATAQLRYE